MFDYYVQILSNSIKFLHLGRKSIDFCLFSQTNRSQRAIAIRRNKKFDKKSPTATILSKTHIRAPQRSLGGIAMLVATAALRASRSCLGGPDADPVLAPLLAELEALKVLAGEKIRPRLDLYPVFFAGGALPWLV